MPNLQNSTMKPSDASPLNAFPSVLPYLGPTFLEQRVRAGRSQSWVAATAGVSRSTLSAFENGKRIHLSVEYLERLAHTLDLTLPLLLELAHVHGQRVARCRI